MVMFFRHLVDKLRWCFGTYYFLDIIGLLLLRILQKNMERSNSLINAVLDEEHIHDCHVGYISHVASLTKIYLFNVLMKNISFIQEVQ